MPYFTPGLVCGLYQEQKAFKERKGTSIHYTTTEKNLERFNELLKRIQIIKANKRGVDIESKCILIEVKPLTGFVRDSEDKLQPIFS